MRFKWNEKQINEKKINEFEQREHENEDDNGKDRELCYGIRAVLRYLVFRCPWNSVKNYVLSGMLDDKRESNGSQKEIKQTNKNGTFKMKRSERERDPRRIANKGKTDAKKIFCNSIATTII